MGNDHSRKAFKGQGNSLSGEKVPPQSTKEDKTKQSGNVLPRAMFKTKQRAQPKQQTAEEIAEKRAKQLEAAEKRSKQWDDQLQRNRERRAKMETENEWESGGGTAESSANALLETVDHSQVQKQLDKDAQRLDESGFNPYSATFASSGQARAVINMDGMNAQATEGGNSMRSPAPAPEAPGSSISTDDSVNGQVSTLLTRAIESGNPTLLSDTIQQVSDLLSAGVIIRDNVTENQLDHARAVLLSLSPVEETEELPEVSGGSAEKDIFNALLGEFTAAATLDQQTASASIKTILKVLTNIHDNPSEEKFRKLKLSNPAIRSKLVNFAGGSPIQLLLNMGFVNEESEEDGEIVRLPSEGLDEMETKYSGVCYMLNHLLEQFGSQ